MGRTVLFGPSPPQLPESAMNDGLVHIATYDGLVHSPDAIVAHPPGDPVAQPPGHVIIPTPPADQVIHVIQEGIIGHVINELV